MQKNTDQWLSVVPSLSSQESAVCLHSCWDSEHLRWFHFEFEIATSVIYGSAKHRHEMRTGGLRCPMCSAVLCDAVSQNEWMIPTKSCSVGGIGISMHPAAPAYVKRVSQ